MTLEELAAKPSEILTCADVAPLLACSPWTLHEQAMEDPYALGFPVIVAKRRVKIPKRAFIRFMAGEMFADGFGRNSFDWR